MADTPTGAKPAPQAAPSTLPSPLERLNTSDLKSRRDTFAMHIAAAILMRQNARSPLALAMEVIKFTDALLVELDK